MIAFLHPLLLTALLALPFIYLLLRVIPPAAKRVLLPTIRFLHDLDQKNPPVHKIPWWILLLRLLMLACLIIGLAHPVINPSEKLSGSGELVLIVDNGWAASQTWPVQQTEALRLATQAQRDNRPVKLVLTAPLAGETQPQFFPTASAGQVIAQLKGLTIAPWPGLPALVAKGLAADKEKSLYWITAGLAEPGYADLVSLSDSLKVFVPAQTDLPLILRAPGEDQPASLGRIEAVTGMPGQVFQVRATDAKGRLVDQASARVIGGQGYVDVLSSLPVTELTGITRAQLASRNGAGAVMLRPQHQGNDKVGLISTETEKTTYHLSDPAYYISRAVEPFAKFTTGPVETLIESNPGIIVIADGGELPPRTLEQLDAWIKKGGIVLRFANSSLAQNGDALTPVPLRPYERSLQGQLTWDNPLSIASFNEASPFAGMAIPADIQVRRQVLAEPLPDLAEHTWVTLSDKTPLITAKYDGKGLLVLVHTTATPDWSDLPLSGFYIEIFKKLTALAARSVKDVAEGTTLQPLLVMNGFGQLVQPPAVLKPIARADFAQTLPSSLHPPGLYGTNEESQPLNLGDRLPPLEPLSSHVQAGNLMTTQGAQEIDLAKPFLYAALMLFILDTLIILILSGFGMRLRKILPLLILFIPHLAQAADSEMANQIHLAYIRTGDTVIDQTSERGLENLSEALRNRTAVEPGKVIGLTPGTDPLVFYPFIYWPIAQSQPDLSAEAATALQSYLDHGGMILLDTRDGIYQPGQVASSAQIERVRSLLKNVSVNPLAQAPETHVLFKSFYLLNLFPEFSQSGDIWIEDNALDEDVSSLVLTGHDWARLWASDGSTPYDEKEMATRFGVNAVMYALTGNYKADQIHMQAILERLGK